MKANLHTPVLLREVIDGLRIEEGKRYIDGTLGMGGHGIEILKRGGVLLGIDADLEALEFTKKRFRDLEIKRFRQEKFPDLQVSRFLRYSLVHGNFRDIETIAKTNGFGKADGVLLDLGVSSYQIDTPKRGFSYRFVDQPLDLRFDQSKGETAAQLINTLSEEALYDIFATYGEEQFARPIATAFIIARRLKPVMTTGDVVRIVKHVTSHSQHQTGILARIFQALRIYVNSELEILRMGLAGTKNLLVPGGRLVVISFHSLEDRIVKQFLDGSGWQVTTRKPIVPDYLEIRSNNRSRSAKLRSATRI